MPELCLSITSTTSHFSTLFISDFLFFFFSLHSLSTSLLLLLLHSLLSSTCKKSHLLSPLSSSPFPLFSFLFSACCSVVQTLWLHNDHENHCLWRLGDFKFIKMVFLGHPFEYLDCKSAEGSESCILEGTQVEFWDCKSVEGSESSVSIETPVEFCKSAEGRESSNLVEIPVEFLDCKSAEGSESSSLDTLCYDNGSSTGTCDHYQNLRDKLGENSAEMGSTRGIMKKKMLEDFLKELDVFENMTCADTVEEKETEPKGTKLHKAKDWKRTLGCKFYEERHNASDSTGERMDLLWEKYEIDSIKNNENRDSSKKKIKKKGGLRSYSEEEQINEHIEQLCCLQALKFSAGKMNLGMGRANLVRISKAIKEFKWLHHVSKNNKKVHCGD